ncbi:MAG: P-type conjugative transfer protein TrbL [Mizugakiibacter sp.]|uniref:P-type conjugative transfer protein TrbL n=1 Tax=Rhodanobacteraceae TaxID=1775411 RepID=UPI0029661796|nr:P-type conjugative transfer protein TrbL [Rhodanobacter sp. KK11]MCE5232315.1 P-type conjugative transfer protein TrbL [Xanthomonadaceae bacterium]MDW2982469.1 P-type conjugative transfer protein TrbL [Rhodanobacter sp. KK11]
MNDLSVIDQFLAVFSQYIDSGFGLLHGEVAYLSATLIVIDMTLAGLFWAMGGEEVLPKLIRKTLYVGAFAYIIGNFNTLAGIVFRSFAGLGLLAAGSTVSIGDFLQPGRLAQIGVTAGQPILLQLGTMSHGFTAVFSNLDMIVVLLLAWIVVVISFFILAVQLFVTLIEFKLTTLAGFVLVPFALWNKTAFLAEKVLGNVVSSGVKVLVLAVIVGIGSTIFGQFQTPTGADPSLNHVLAIMLASLTMLGLGIFGPGIATGLVSGAPQLGAGAAAGTALGAAGLAVAGGAAIATGGAAVAAGTRLAARGAVGTARAGSGAATAYRAGTAASGATGARAFGAGMANVARSGAQAAGQRMAAGARAVRNRVASAASATPASSSPAGKAPSTPAASAAVSPTSDDKAPDWAQRLQRRQRVAHGASTAAHVMRSADHGGGGAAPDLRDSSNE